MHNEFHLRRIVQIHKSDMESREYDRGLPFVSTNKVMTYAIRGYVMIQGPSGKVTGKCLLTLKIFRIELWKSRHQPAE